jgi:hypothetical protein
MNLHVVNFLQVIALIIDIVIDISLKYEPWWRTTEKDVVNTKTSYFLDCSLNYTTCPHCRK